jgi:hypothetical protein
MWCLEAKKRFAAVLSVLGAAPFMGDSAPCSALPVTAWSVAGGAVVPQMNRSGAASLNARLSTEDVLRIRRPIGGPVGRSREGAKPQDGIRICMYGYEIKAIFVFGSRRHPRKIAAQGWVN